MGHQLPPRSSLASHFVLSDDVVFLNHGSFGAAPRAVLDAQHALRARLEHNPMQFLVRDLEGLLDASRARLAAFVGAAPAELAFVPNATTGVNTVLRSLRFAPGDELVTTNHEYNACKNALDAVAHESGAKVVVARVPFPLSDPAEVLLAILAVVTPRTRLCLVDHVTSPTGLVFPIPAIAQELARRGIDVLVDGAHTPGMVPLDLHELGVPFYTANCHKWLCAPKGAAFLYVREDRQKSVRPLTLSHGANSERTDRSRFLVEFDWTGTSDPTPQLCIGDALACLDAMVPGGLDEIMKRNRALALEARTILANALGVDPPAPESMIGSMAAVPLPDGKATVAASLYGDALQEVLQKTWHVEVPIVPWPAPPKRLVRVSAQLYDTREEYVYLADKLVTELARE
ncbi:MAG TPA: aminotransferase class V-fold PLP-dependent enzyme [Polyangiaceae bacterium]